MKKIVHIVGIKEKEKNILTSVQKFHVNTLFNGLDPGCLISTCQNENNFFRY